MKPIDGRYLTAGIEGIGGRIKAHLEDFQVEEVPLYPPCGHGEHAYVRVEKHDLSTLEAVDRLSQALGVNRVEIGFAGLKDRKSVSRQTFSVRLIHPERLTSLEIPGLGILGVDRHRNKLRVGHLRGNRFRIVVRDVAPERVGGLRRMLEILREKGVPNYYGPQRFGSRGDSHLIGKALLERRPEDAIRRFLGMPSPREANPDVVEARRLFDAGDLEGSLRRFPPSYRLERTVLQYLIRSGVKFSGAVRRIRKDIRRLFLSAYQSFLFNRCLDRRMEITPDSLGILLAGDRAVKHSSGGMFIVEDPEVEQPRADRFEVSPTGPIFGKDMMPAGGIEGEIEDRVLEEEGMSPKAFHALQQGFRLGGSRRPYRYPVEDLSWDYSDGILQLGFFLPKGAYATALLREIMKTEEPVEGEPTDDP